jgi:hypothetical protein
VVYNDGRHSAPNAERKICSKEKVEHYRTTEAGENTELQFKRKEKDMLISQRVNWMQDIFEALLRYKIY